MEVKLEFSVRGHVRQTIDLLDTKITPEQLIVGLNKGEYLTTIQEGGDVIVNEPGDHIIARVLDVDNECEYDDFIIYRSTIKGKD